MNKKLLFAAMSLAALTACTNDDFESKQIAAEESSPIQFEVINDALTRASMDGNKIVWNANDGDLFTLYHGSPAAPWTTGYENATYKANANEGGTATLTTPTMIKAGGAIMVWPVDTTFRIKPADALTLKIPAEQKNIENNIPYVSDLIEIDPYAAYSETAAPGVIPTAYRTAGLGRKYKIFMRPMASQLIVKADYAGTDATLATLYTIDDPIEEIKVTSVDLLTQTGGATLFTTEIPLAFNAPTTAIQTQWNTVANNKWDQVTSFDIANIAAAGQTDKLTTECLSGNESAKFLILPQANMADGTGGVADAAVVVNTIYGKVYVAANGVGDSQYSTAEAADAWYRFLSTKPATDAEGETTKATKETSGEGAGKYKCTSLPAFGMKQTLNGFSTYTATTGVVKGEPVGAAATRYVKVLLTHLDMTDLHVKSDKQLRDAARVWKKMGLAPVTVYLDGDGSNEFKMSQKTIETINSINSGKTFANWFKVKPCQVASHKACNTIVITGGGDIQDIAFIAANGAFQADVALNAGETWTWKVASYNGKFKVTDAGVAKIINRGTMENTAEATLKTTENNGTTQNNIPFVNNGTWNINGATINVQFDVTNNGTVNIAKDAQYRQDGRAFSTTFVNDATAKPSRFGGNDSKIGKVINKGVFATVAVSGNSADINNYGLIEHADKDAKTYVTTNQTAGANFASAFANPANKMGRINLPYSNKDEDNVSVSAALNQGFVSVTIDGEVSGTLTNTALGNKVNYVIVKSGVTSIASLAQVDYLEINSPGTEIAWSVATPAAFDGLMVLSDVNIKLGTTVTVNKATYLGADMYVGGTFVNASWSGYYGNTTSKVATNYITY